MSGVFRNTDPLTARRVCTLWCGGGHTRGVERGGVSIVRKTPDTALYSMYVSTLWDTPTKRPSSKDPAAKGPATTVREKQEKRKIGKMADCLR
jgi:hypothetical protein